MKALRIAFVLMLIAITCCLAAAQDNALSEREQREGWQLLWDGSTWTGWTGVDENWWKIESGEMITVPGGGGLVETEARYGDFILSLDFMGEKANSGVFVRIGDPSDPVYTGIEVAIDDSADWPESDRHETGAIYDCLAPIVNVCKPAGEWQHMTVYAKDNLLIVVLNDIPVVNMDLNQWTEAHKNPDGSDNKFPTAYKDMPREGHLGLQHHGQRVHFRNIKLFSIDEE